MHIYFAMVAAGLTLWILYWIFAEERAPRESAPGTGWMTLASLGFWALFGVIFVAAVLHH
jgi:hypothetical protein